VTEAFVTQLYAACEFALTSRQWAKECRTTDVPEGVLRDAIELEASGLALLRSAARQLDTASEIEAAVRAASETN
jgi:hypothetical protein